MSDNMIRVCAFCKRQSRLTQEHLFPKSLLNHKKDERKPDRSKRFLAKINKFVDGELTIGDVCAVCNNGVLSNLDGYFNEIYKRYICNYVALGQSKRFTYDFDRLARWLLKISYNHARVHDSPDRSSLEKCVDFILHGKPKPKGLSIFLLLVTPHKIKDPMVLRPSLRDIKEIKPDVLRATRGDVYSPNSGKIIFRIVHINSYFFLCLVPDQESYRAAQWYGDLKGIKKRYPGIYQLRSNKKDANETSVNVKGAVDIIKMFEDYTPSANLEHIFDLIE